MNINKLMKQAQQMQKQMMEAQEKLKEKSVEVSVGGGMVKITMNGGYEVIDLIIDDEVVKVEEKDMLKDLLISAVNEARAKVDEMVKEEMSKYTGGMNFPGF